VLFRPAPEDKQELREPLTPSKCQSPVAVPQAMKKMFAFCRQRLAAHCSSDGDLQKKQSTATKEQCMAMLWWIAFSDHPG
jgi:hypothetical protein